MRHLILCIAIASAAIADQASAQTPPKTLEEMNKQMEQQEIEARKHPKRGFQETSLTPMNLSMTEMLNTGWAIVGGAWGVGLTLRKDAKWAVCEVDDGRSFKNLPGSRCLALN